MRSKREIVQNIEQMKRLLEDTEDNFNLAIECNDLENKRMLFLDRALMKARLRVLDWILEERGFPI